MSQPPTSPVDTLRQYLAERTGQTATPAEETGAVAPATLAEAVRPKKPHPVSVLYKHFRASHDLVHAEGKAYAVPRALDELHGPPGVARGLDAELRRTMVRIARSSPDIPRPLSEADAKTVAFQLEADAFSGPETSLAFRFHYDPEARQVCIDLGDAAGRVVVVDDEWWSIEEQPPPGVIFRRSHATKPLPDPAPGGRLDGLSGLLALDPGGDVFRALLGWLIGLVFDDTRSAVRPGVLLTGPYGSGKSTRLRLVTSVVEPSDTSALGSAFGRSFPDDQVRALHRAIPLWDNLTSVSGAVSDALCCLITGTARESRSLYSDNDLNTVPIRRPVGLTAVGIPAGLRPDALDRLITLEVDSIAERVADTQIQARFDAAHPQLLGALCSAVSAVLAYRPHVAAPTEHRMAGHAHVLAALDAAVGAGDERVVGVPAGMLEAFTTAGRQVKQRTAAEDVFGGALLAMLDSRGGSWQGKASELLTAAAMHAPWHDRPPGGGWPSSARRVPEVLNHLREGLAALGVTWSTTTVRGSTRYAITGPRQDQAAGHPTDYKPTPAPTPTPTPTIPL